MYFLLVEICRRQSTLEGRRNEDDDNDNEMLSTVQGTFNYNYYTTAQGLVVRPLQTERWCITLSRRINTKSSIKLKKF